MADPRLKQNEVILEGWVYDLDAFGSSHPGGAGALNIFGGSDATTHYYMLHPHQQLRTKALEPFKLRKAEEPTGQKAALGDSAFLLNTKAYQDLKQRVRKAIPYQFATWEWYAKAVAIMALSAYLEYDSVASGFALWKSALLGVLMAMVGLCIQHDANHGAVSQKGWVNRAWGFTQDWIGGSALLWKHHHVLMHHAETNVEGDDPDITGELIRFNKLTTWKGHHKWQAVYTWALLPLLPLSWHFKEVWDLAAMQHCDRKMSSMARQEALFALAFRIVFIVRFYAIPLYYHPTLHTAACLLTCLAVGGAYLGVNFVISHNFEGAKSVLDTADRSKHTKRDWAFEQVETSSTVGGRLLGFFHGGLNYQIEHHLFPRISHVHYHKLKPVVQQWCLDNGIKYTYYRNLPENIASCYKHLSLLGNAKQIG
uniref:Cytochrome b5 heme-binding domain-containing protein n=1 Tax=Hemiselmis tepida TaxID=464990 RepID=A0A7S0VTU3_9CRYP